MTPSMLIASKYNNSTIGHAAPPLHAIVLSLQLGDFGESYGVVGGQRKLVAAVGVTLLKLILQIKQKCNIKSPSIIEGVDKSKLDLALES